MLINLDEARKDSPEFRASLQRLEDNFEDCLRLQEAAIRILRTFLEDFARTQLHMLLIYGRTIGTITKAGEGCTGSDEPCVPRNGPRCP